MDAIGNSSDNSRDGRFPVLHEKPLDDGVKVSYYFKNTRLACRIIHNLVTLQLHGQPVHRCHSAEHLRPLYLVTKVDPGD